LFWKLTGLVFEHNNLHSLFQLGALSVLNLEELSVTNNPVTTYPYYRLYAIARLDTLTRLDGSPVTPAERRAATQHFGPLAEANPPASSPLAAMRGPDGMGVRPSVKTRKARAHTLT
jgi:hypothetical protein